MLLCRGRTVLSCDWKCCTINWAAKNYVDVTSPLACAAFPVVMHYCTVVGGGAFTVCLCTV